MLNSTRPPQISLLALALLAGLTCYLAATLGAAIRSTRSLEHDAAYYCEVVERAQAGQGFTSLSDRRGPAQAHPFPQPFRAANRWPWLAAGICAITGEVPQTMMFTSLAALLAAVWLAAWTIQRSLRTTWWMAAACIAGGLCFDRALETAALPLTDSVSLLLNIAVIAALATGKRPATSAALCLAALACAVRFQNVALAFPLAWVLLSGTPRRLTLIAGLGLAVMLAGSRAPAGVAAFVLPWEEASLLRATRWMFPPLIAGLLLAARRPLGPLGPIVWLMIGHFAVLAANEDTSRQGSWLFGLRHGWPFHFAAAALAARALTGSRGVLRAILAGCIGLAAIDNLPHAWHIAAQRTGIASSRAAHEDMLEWLRRNPLPADAVVFSRQADELARELRVATVHSRGFPTDDPGLIEQLRRRRVTHMLLLWADMPMLQHLNRRATAFAAALEPHVISVREEVREAPTSRALLLRWRRP